MKPFVAAALGAAAGAAGGLLAVNRITAAVGDGDQAVVDERTKTYRAPLLAALAVAGAGIGYAVAAGRTELALGMLVAAGGLLGQLLGGAL